MPAKDRPPGPTWIPRVFRERWNRAMMQIGVTDPDIEYRNFLRNKEARRAAGFPETITIPGWDDVVRLVPREEIDPRRAQAHREAIKKGLPSPLTSTEQFELQRRKAVARQIMDSPTPEVVQGVANILTIVDDVNDFISVAASGVIIAANVAARPGKFLIPIAKGLLAAKDITDIIQDLARLPLRGFGAKRRMFNFLGLNPFSKVARARRLRKIHRKIPGIGAAIEAAQVTEQLFGVGLSLGPIMGSITDTIFGTAKWVAGRPVRIQEPLAPAGTELLLNLDQRFGGPGDRLLVNQAAEIIANGYASFIGPQILPLEEHLRALVAVRLAIEILKDVLPAFGWGDLLGDEGSRPLVARGPTAPLTVLALEELGIDLEATRRWPVPGNPETITTEALVQTTLPTLQGHLRRVFEEEEKSDLLLLYLTLASETAEELFYLLDGSRDGLEFSQTFSAWLAVRSIEWGIKPPPGTTDEQVQAWVEQVSLLHRLNNLEFPVEQILRDSARGLWGGIGR